MLPVGVVIALALASLLLACLRRRGCCGGKRSRPIVGASYPPAYGTGYPNQVNVLFCFRSYARACGSASQCNQVFVLSGSNMVRGFDP